MMKLSIIIPVFNEEKTISQMLEKINRLDVDNVIKQVIIVNDGSTDRTKNEIENFVKNHSEVKSVTHAKNQGKGAAIRTGIETATGEYVVIQDADLEYDPQDYYNLIKPIIDNKTKVVYGSRLLNPNFKQGYSLNLFATKLLSFLSNLLYNAKITDEPTCYKVFRTEVIRSINLKCKKFEFCPEVTAKVRKKGYKIYEVPINYYPRSIAEGKKINWKDGVEAIWTLVKYRFID